ncbi:hypothetical protein SFOMI_0382 [Sphingobium fuliginis]|uniref:Uncharacterized protein n=1 Tax=Sphingobium fuliginis (strain ATCC 27551) TaxID=336203 RepID=A0A292ZAK9_SPHSA|nr:hypothetical protein SFOMI_0382 [Sphingobium fuliginis]
MRALPRAGLAGAGNRLHHGAGRIGRGWRGAGGFGLGAGAGCEKQKSNQWHTNREGFRGSFKTGERYPTGHYRNCILIRP